MKTQSSIKTVDHKTAQRYREELIKQYGLDDLGLSQEEIEKLRQEREKQKERFRESNQRALEGGEGLTNKQRIALYKNVIKSTETSLCEKELDSAYKCLKKYPNKKLNQKNEISSEDAQQIMDTLVNLPYQLDESHSNFKYPSSSTWAYPKSQQLAHIVIQKNFKTESEHADKLVKLATMVLHRYKQLRHPECKLFTADEMIKEPYKNFESINESTDKSHIYVMGKYNLYMK